jgi:predicted dinucleotide-binding enzyme
LKACILEEYANFKGNVARLVVQAKVKHSPRQYITETLQELVKSAGGVTGVLTAGDDADMKAEIASLQRKIASLGQAEKNHKKTREMDVLAVRALELWV